MKISVISIYPARGEKHSKVSGIASYTKNLVTNLAKKDNEITVICDILHNGVEEYREDELKIKRVFRKNPSYVFTILKSFLIGRPDVIHFQQEKNIFGSDYFAPLQAVLVLLIWILRIKLVITFHAIVSFQAVTKEFIQGNNVKWPVWFVKLGFWGIYFPQLLFADKIIVHEVTFKKILVEEYGAKEGKIVVVPHGVEDLVSKPKKDARDALGIIRDTFVVLFVGYLTGYKGIDLLLEGYSEYCKLGDNNLLIMGSGIHPTYKNNEKYLQYQYNRSKKKASELLSKSNYIWPGFIDEEDLATYYCASDVIVFPYTNSLAASGPMAMAIGYGIPFIGSEVFENIFVDSLLFKKDPKSLSKKLKHVRKNTALYKKRVLEIRKKRLWSHVCKSTIDIYTQL
jgi:glycosyltransferase involved in cell wall biosynthesis